MTRDVKYESVDCGITGTEAYKYMGAHFVEKEGKHGVVFRTWAPNAAAVSVVGDFNGWNTFVNPMTRNKYGLYETFIEGLHVYDCYKYAVTSAQGTFLKADPFAFHAETSPGTASKLYDLSGYDWKDGKWQADKEKSDVYSSPVNIYKVDIGSWRRYPDGSPLSYAKAARELATYVREMGYTHVELMPVSEYPDDGSLGYGVTGYYAPTSRYGTPHDFMCFVDTMHREGIGVILDWVPSHFPKHSHGLCRYDGGCCFEHPDPKRGERYELGAAVFDYGREEVQSFLISSAVYWMDIYHIDGLMVSSVASMLYLDYNRRDGEWSPNKYGGKENLEAVDFIRRLNSEIFSRFPQALMIAEESSGWSLVTKPTDVGGLGFNFKWNTGWMKDILGYMSLDPIHRKFNHGKLTFSFFYAFSENYVLPACCGEMSKGSCSLINKMPGEYDDKFASLRAFMAYMTAHPGKKLMFMGQEFAQFNEWDHARELDWMLLDYGCHRSAADFVKHLNVFYKNTPSLWQVDYSREGFSWIANDDADQSVISFRRIDKEGRELIVVCNFVPVNRHDYCIGVMNPGRYRVVLNTDDARFGGKGVKTPKMINAKKLPMHGMEQSVSLTLPALSVLYIEPEENDKPRRIQH